MSVIFNKEQLKSWDLNTINHEPISAIDLMERAASKCVGWIKAQNFQNKVFHIFCGQGNNGGDGLAIGRQLRDNGYHVVIYIVKTKAKGSPEFEINLGRLNKLDVICVDLYDLDKGINLDNEDIILDCIFGSGLNRNLDAFHSSVINIINATAAIKIAIDVPSGFNLDVVSKKDRVVHANFTLTFQTQKLAFLLPENEVYTGKVVVLDIQLHPHFLSLSPSETFLTDKSDIQRIYKKRKSFAHKGTYGHALVVGGSYGKIGAPLLASKACLRTGAGLVSTVVPKCGYQIMQAGAPEAMTVTSHDENFITNLPTDLTSYKAIGIGIGLGTKVSVQTVVHGLIHSYTASLVLDADALNCLAKNKQWIHQLPPNTLLTPHPKEFERLFGSTENSFDQINLASQKAKELSVIIILKVHHTLIALPDGRKYFNCTGNAGMAKGGSGDVLTGILTSLLAQGYSPEETAILGVYLHGLAGDLAAESLSMEAMLSSDIIEFLPQAFKQIAQYG